MHQKHLGFLLGRGHIWDLSHMNFIRGETRNVCLDYLCEYSWLVSLLHHVHLRPAVPLIISDVNRDLRGLQALEAITLAATPLIHILQGSDTRMRK